MPLYTTAADVAAYIKRHGRKTMYIPKRIADLSTLRVASTGPRPSIAGMRKKFWGEDAIIGLQGSYGFKVADR